MNVLMMLADMAQLAENKLYILGGGWNVTGPQPVPHAVVLKFEVESHEFDRPHHWELFLEDADGQLVHFDTPDGPQALEIRGDFSIASSSQLEPGTPVSVPIPVNLAPLPLAPGSRYAWRLVVDGESLPGSLVSFAVRALPSSDDVSTDVA